MMTIVAIATSCGADSEIVMPRGERALPAPTRTSPARPAADQIRCGSDSLRILLLHDALALDPLPDLSDLTAKLTSNLLSRFGTSTALAVGDYQPGQINGYDSIVYVSSNYEQTFPPSLLDDLVKTDKTVIWSGTHAEQLFAHDPTFAGRRGFAVTGNGPSSSTSVRYQNTTFNRVATPSEVATIAVVDPSLATVIAESQGDGPSRPWAVQSGNWTLVAEATYDAAPLNDRYLIWTDVLVSVLDPDAPTQRRALVRIEDIDPMTNPEHIRAITQALSSRDIPFSLAVIPMYRDPLGSAGQSQPMERDLADAPELVEAIHDAMAHGATVLMHGVTHQYDAVANPYNGRSGADYEFKYATTDENDRVIELGPVPDDSKDWVTYRINAGFAEFERAGLPRPTMFEFPHYAASEIDYEVVSSMFPARYERSQYYSTGKSSDQFAPYVMRDVYGACVIPETLGFVSPDPLNGNEVRLPEDLVASAQQLLALRDGVASFFFHPTLPVTYLETVVDGIVELGYEFVPPGSLVGVP